MSRHIRAGICGLCGTAVVQPDHPKAGWLQGHLYKSDLTLHRVRCMRHSEESDPRYYDHNGDIREDRWPGEPICI